MKKFVLLTIFMLPVALSAATYFASPDGKGDGYSMETPVTFTEGLKLLKNPGDTLYLLAGLYDLGNTPIQNLNGIASKRIVISGYESINRSGKYSAILDFRSTPYGTRGLQIKSTCTYLHLKNLTLRYSGKNNLYNEGSYNLFENLDIYGSADTGCQMKNGGYNVIKNVDSHDNFDYETTSGGTANFGGNADGFADKQFTGPGNHYIGCRAWNNSDDGWDFYQRGSTSNTIIENCICFQNGLPYYNMRNNPRVETDKNWFNSKIGTTMTDRYGNTITITLEKYPCQGNGNGFKMGGAYTDHKVLIHHCLAVGNYANGFDQNNNDGTMWVYNCSAYQNNLNYCFTTAYGTNHLRNCLTLSGKEKDRYAAKSVVANDHNSWNSGFSCSANDFLSLDTTQVLMYRTSDGSLPQITFMHLTESSKLIDAGIDLNLGYNGTAPDLGCYETEGEHHEPEPEPEPQPQTQPEGTHSVAFVTVPGCLEDKQLLAYLRKNDSLWVVETEAADPEVDYSDFEVIVLGSKPNSSVAGFTPLKGYNKPMLLLKPFLLKANAWNWGNAVNTQDLSISVAQPQHPLFRRLTITENGLQLFSKCTTNAVTAISAWTNTQGYETLAAPLSLPDAVTIADFPAGTDCNGTVLAQRMVMIGISEYSSADLTEDGKRLVENAIYYLLGMDFPTGWEQQTSDNNQTHTKFIQNGTLFIQMGEAVYDVTGRCISR